MKAMGVWASLTLELEYMHMHAHRSRVLTNRAGHFEWSVKEASLHLTIPHTCVVASKVGPYYPTFFNVKEQKPFSSNENI